MFYALIVLCSTKVNFCVRIEDTWGPYTTKEACIERIEQLDVQIQERLVPSMLGRGVPGPLKSDKFCSDLGTLRQYVPGAFEGEDLSI